MLRCELQRGTQAPAQKLAARLVGRLPPEALSCASANGAVRWGTLAPLMLVGQMLPPCPWLQPRKHSPAALCVLFMATLLSIWQEAKALLMATGPLAGQHVQTHQTAPGAAATPLLVDRAGVVTTQSVTELVAETAAEVVQAARAGTNQAVAAGVVAAEMMAAVTTAAVTAVTAPTMMPPTASRLI